MPVLSLISRNSPKQLGIVSPELRRRMLIAQTAAVKGPCPEALRGGCHRAKMRTMSAELPADTVAVKVT